jgi:hypothetical protein
VVKEDEIREVAGQPIEAAADEFVRRALERGAPDNVTVIVARVETVPGEPGDEVLDETLTLDAPDPMAFDETVKDTQPVPVLDPDGAVDGGVATPAAEPVAGAVQGAQADPTAEAAVAPADVASVPVAPSGKPQAPVTPEAPAPPQRSALLRWTIVALVLVAAGAWFYWNH